MLAGAYKSGTLIVWKESMGVTSKRSLRSQVEKWLGPTSSTPVRVTRFSRARSNQRPCVRIELLLPAGPLGFFFFRHRDGTWCVFPPETERVAMHAYQGEEQSECVACLAVPKE
jgi:hypothetical protein